MNQKYVAYIQNVHPSFRQRFFSAFQIIQEIFTRAHKIELSSIKLKVIRDIRIMRRACNQSCRNRLVAERERSLFAPLTIQ